jgi:hypothetical protein
MNTIAAGLTSIWHQDMRPRTTLSLIVVVGQHTAFARKQLQSIRAIVTIVSVSSHQDRTEQLCYFLGLLVPGADWSDPVSSKVYFEG